MLRGFQLGKTKCCILNIILTEAEGICLPHTVTQRVSGLQELGVKRGTKEIQKWQRYFCFAV